MTETARAVFDYVVSEILEGQDEDLLPTTPLLELGLLNSLEIRRLLAFIQARYDIVIPTEHVIAENLQNIRSIAALVDRLRPS